MKTITSRFNLYDHFGYFLVGLYQIITNIVVFYLAVFHKFPNFSILSKVENSIGIVIFLGEFIRAGAFSSAEDEGRPLKSYGRAVAAYYELINETETRAKVEDGSRWVTL